MVSWLLDGHAPKLQGRGEGAYLPERLPTILIFPTLVTNSNYRTVSWPNLNMYSYFLIRFDKTTREQQRIVFQPINFGSGNAFLTWGPLVSWISSTNPPKLSMVSCNICFLADLYACPTLRACSCLYRGRTLYISRFKHRIGMVRSSGIRSARFRGSAIDSVP